MDRSSRSCPLQMHVVVVRGTVEEPIAVVVLRIVTVVAVQVEDAEPLPEADVEHLLAGQRRRFKIQHLAAGGIGRRRLTRQRRIEIPGSELMNASPELVPAAEKQIVLERWFDR